MSKIILITFLFWSNLALGADEIKAILIHPIYDQPYACSEHPYGQLKSMGDSLGTDCWIEKLEKRKGLLWMYAYTGDGSKNSDWYGWQKNVLAPIDGVITETAVNDVENKPGALGKGIASYIEIKQEDGARVILAHVGQIQVKEGDKVKAGQIIAKVGNNGQSRHPHIHIGAWKDKEAFQIRFDQKKMKSFK